MEVGMQFVYDDGGRAAAGYKGHAGDCVARSIAIATGRPYAEVYDALAAGNAGERQTKQRRGSAGRTARSGIHVTRKWFKDYMTSLGWEWVPTMHIGSGCKVHLVDGELPSGRLIVSVSKHYTAVVDGAVHDTHDPQRATHWYKPDMTLDRVSHRCVYGYWRRAV
jgi:hypothetical protein